MSTVRGVSFNGLRARLGDFVLIWDPRVPPIFEQFAKALDSRDAAVLQTAIEALETCPEPLRQDVQAAFVAWLFDDADASGLLDLPVPSAACH